METFTQSPDIEPTLTEKFEEEYNALFENISDEIAQLNTDESNDDRYQTVMGEKLDLQDAKEALLKKLALENKDEDEGNHREPTMRQLVAELEEQKGTYVYAPQLIERIKDSK